MVEKRTVVTYTSDIKQKEIGVRKVTGIFTLTILLVNLFLFIQNDSKIDFYVAPCLNLLILYLSLQSVDANVIQLLIQLFSNL